MEKVAGLIQDRAKNTYEGRIGHSYEVRVTYPYEVRTFGAYFGPSSASFADGQRIYEKY